MAAAAAAFCWNAWSGRETQLKIWIGIAVNSLLSHSKLTNGNSPEMGEFGRKAMKLSAPIVMMGAVSPIARDRPRMRPVRMPPVE